MKRIYLSKLERKVLLSVHTDGTDMDILPQETISTILEHLKDMGYVDICYNCGEVYSAKLTNKGKKLKLENPKLRNPINWQMIATLATLVFSLASLILAFFQLEN